MDITPTHAVDHRDQHVADLRDALALAVRWLAFSAGRTAADSPEHSDQLMSVAEDMQVRLARTAP